MAQFAELSGQRIVSGSIVFPYYGTWSADVVLADTTSIPTSVTLTVGNLSLVGSVFRMASFSGSRSARIVGGAAGWRKTIPAQAYQNPAGIRVSLLLGDAAMACGESVIVGQDSTIGTYWVRESAPASRILRELAGDEWWIDASGITQVGTRTGLAVATTFQVDAWSGAKGSFSIATEDYAAWMPANTFSNITVTEKQTIALSTITVDGDGKARVEILASNGGAIN